MTNGTKDEPEAVDAQIEPALTGFLEALERQIPVLEGAASALQQMQRLVPLPSGKELAEMKRGRRPVNRPVYLLWFLQQSFLALEEAANAAIVEVEEGLAGAEIEDFSPTQFNYVDQAIRYVREAGPIREGEKP